MFPSKEAAEFCTDRLAYYLGRGELAQDAWRFAYNDTTRRFGISKPQSEATQRDHDEDERGDFR